MAFILFIAVSTIFFFFHHTGKCFFFFCFLWQNLKFLNAKKGNNNKSNTEAMNRSIYSIQQNYSAVSKHACQWPNNCNIKIHKYLYSTWIVWTDCMKYYKIVVHLSTIPYFSFVSSLHLFQGDRANFSFSSHSQIIPNRDWQKKNESIDLK